MYRLNIVTSIVIWNLQRTKIQNSFKKRKKKHSKNSNRTNKLKKIKYRTVLYIERTSLKRKLETKTDVFHEPKS